jgi:hypothetical protein
LITDDKLLISFINQVDNHIDDELFFFGFAFGNHQREGYQGVVCNTLSAICLVEEIIFIQKPANIPAAILLLPSEILLQYFKKAACLI